MNEYLLTSPSAKEDRDDLLVYKSIDIKHTKQTRIFGIPIHDLNRDEAVARILSYIEKKQGPKHILCVDPLKLMAFRLNSRTRSIVNKADIILPEGGGLIWASRILGTPSHLKERISIIALMLDLVRLSSRSNFTIYLLGIHSSSLEQVFFNLQKSFPGVRIVGRQGGSFGKQREALVKESLRKSAPDLIFLGMEFPYQELWIRENWSYFSKAVVVGVDSSFDILARRERKVPEWVERGGYRWLWHTITRPWLLLRIAATLFFYFFVVFSYLRIPYLFLRPFHFMNRKIQ